MEEDIKSLIKEMIKDCLINNLVFKRDYSSNKVYVYYDNDLIDSFDITE